MSTHSPHAGFTDRLAAGLLTAGPRPASGLLVRQWSMVVPAPLTVTFDFFSDAANLQRLTPPWVHFEIRTPMPVTMRPGLEIDYRIVVRGLPIPWRTRIEVWEPQVRFVDRQLIGPYRWWWHTHEFKAVPGGTEVIDRVEFLPRLAWATRSVVQRDVERIFDYRRQALSAIDWPERPTPARFIESALS